MKPQGAKRPGLPILLKYARGDKEQIPNWSRFIESDSRSREMVGLLQQLDRLFEWFDLSRARPATHTLGAAIFNHFQRSREAGGAEIGRLYYDSRAIPLPEGMRPSLMSERRMKFAAGDAVVELSIVPVFPGGFQVTGRLENASGAISAAVRLAGRRTYKAELDRYGFFSFSSVNPGEYRLVFGSGTKAVTVPNLDVQ